VEGLIEASGSGSRTFRVDVPENTSALRVDVVDTDSDLDLFAHAGAPFLELDPSVASAEHLYGRETLVVRAREGGPLAAGPWFVDVAAPWDEDRPARFALLATLAAEPPAELLTLPQLPERCPDAAPELARALACVVELTVDDGSGSGVLIGGRGWILTNAHVVERLGGGPVDEVVVAVPLDARRPAVELFRASVERYDAQRDLALLRVQRGFYGQPLPEGYRFPVLEQGAAEGLAIGAPLWLVGYPATGGEGSRVTVSATRGVVAGFERGPDGTLLKTDAEITQGNSGGAALDAQGRLVGVPSSTVENGSGQIGYVRPLELLPEAWRRLAAGKD
jgi:S1-C subfamily serine protease